MITISGMYFGSIPVYITEGSVLQSSSWYQIQCILWIVDDDTAQEVSAQDVLNSYDLENHSVDLGESVEAALYGGDCSGLDFIAFQYGRVFVLINSFYTHPREDCVSLIEVSEAVLARLKEYSQET